MGVAGDKSDMVTLILEYIFSDFWLAGQVPWKHTVLTVTTLRNRGQPGSGGGGERAGDKNWEPRTRNTKFQKTSELPQQKGEHEKENLQLRN